MSVLSVASLLFTTRCRCAHRTRRSRSGRRCKPSPRGRLESLVGAGRSSGREPRWNGLAQRQPPSFRVARPEHPQSTPSAVAEVQSPRGHEEHPQTTPRAPEHPQSPQKETGPQSIPPEEPPQEPEVHQSSPTIAPELQAATEHPLSSPTGARAPPEHPQKGHVRLRRLGGRQYL